MKWIILILVLCITSLVSAQYQEAEGIGPNFISFRSPFYSFQSVTQITTTTTLQVTTTTLHNGVSPPGYMFGGHNGAVLDENKVCSDDDFIGYIICLIYSFLGI